MNILIPMAGAGTRFAKAGYVDPKPFIDVDGMPMIGRVLQNLAIEGARYLLVAQRAHVAAYPQQVLALQACYPITVVPVDGMTEGTACTVLHARQMINDDMPLLIANSDQWVDFSLSDFLVDAQARQLDGAIVTFHDVERNNKWSFARTDASGLVVEVKEKEAISDQATVGIYYFARGADFVDAAIEMLLKRDRVNGEYYTCPVYNYLIRNGKRVGVYPIAAEAMHGLGTPEDLQSYLRWRRTRP